MAIRTPDFRLRVFVSSTLKELADERDAVRRAILRLRLAPVMFELGARPHPADALYQAYLAQSHVFVGIYWQSYGWVAPGKQASGLDDEYQLAANLPRLLYIKGPAPERERALAGLLGRMRAENAGCYKTFATAAELEELVADDLALLLSERFETRNGGRPATGTFGQHRMTNIPSPRNPLIGREPELEAARSMLLREDVALVTLTGPGGSGKSRLGIEVALNSGDEFPDGSYLVELEAITNPVLVLPAIANTLGLTASGGVDVLGALTQHLRDRQVLLLLDNFEQVLDAATPVGDLLRACPKLKILVTSRAPLRLRDESELLVPPLALPPLGKLPEPQSLSRYAAVALFIDRAQAARSDFRMTVKSAPAVAEICQRLDGLPLAIELASARIRMLSPQALLARLEQSSKALEGGIRDLPLRQRTMHDVVDWSYRLLGDDEQRLFRRLGVFVGGWSFEAADAVCNADGERRIDVFDGLERLVDLSLVVPPEEVGTDLRMRTLETIREFALQRLIGVGDEEATRRRHAQFYLALVEASEPQARGPARALWERRVGADYGNIRAALLWGQKHDGELGLRLSAAVWRYWESHNLIGEGRMWLETFLELPLETTAQRGRALIAAAAFAVYQGDFTPARARAEEALSALRGLEDRGGEAHALNELGVITCYEGDYAGAQSFFEQSLAIERQLGSRWGIANTINNLGVIADYHSDYEGAYRLHAESLAMYRELGETNGVAVASGNLGHDAMRLGKWDEAGACQLASLRFFKETGDTNGLAECFERLAMLANAKSDFPLAAGWFGLAADLRKEAGTLLGVAAQQEYDSELALTRSHLDAVTFDRAWAEGRRMSLEAAVVQAGGADS